VDFHFDTKIMNVETTIQDGQETISQLDMIQNGFRIQQTISKDDVVIMTLGSTVSGVTRGTNDRPPGRHSLEPHDELDENWSLWLEIGSWSHVFGNPYNFCTRESESLLESFTITTADSSLIEYVDLHAHNVTEAGTFISFQESSWKLSCCIPTQPVFSQQPKTIRIFWGFALFPRRPGNYIEKAMYDCSGAEITIEVLGHLHFSSPTLRTMTIPRVMPRMSAMLLIRSLRDRPPVLPQNTSNLGLVGQFVEIPHFSCVDTSYSVRTAQVAVSQLMGIDMQYVRERKPSILDLLKTLLWK
jgi:oleate hydratase